MDNLYKSFIQERMRCEFLEYENVGWASYSIVNSVCNLQNVYIAPEERKKGYSQKIGKEIENIAKENGCKVLKTSIEIFDNQENRANLYAILKFGFNLVNAGNNSLVFLKRI